MHMARVMLSILLTKSQVVLQGNQSFQETSCFEETNCLEDDQSVQDHPNRRNVQSDSVHSVSDASEAETTPTTDGAAS